MFLFFPSVCLVWLGFELKVSSLQSRCSTSWATPPVHFALIILEIGGGGLWELFTLAGLTWWPSWSQPPNLLGVQACATGQETGSIHFFKWLFRILWYIYLTTVLWKTCVWRLVATFFFSTFSIIYTDIFLRSGIAGSRVDKNCSTVTFELNDFPQCFRRLSDHLFTKNLLSTHHMAR
jgi:hypothetical protein